MLLGSGQARVLYSLVSEAVAQQYIHVHILDVHLVKVEGVTAVYMQLQMLDPCLLKVGATA